MTKICSNCKRELDISFFYKNKTKKDGHQSTCKECKKEYNHKDYMKNKEYFLEKSRKQKESLRKWLQEYKQTLKCKKCGEDRWYVLQFHHTDPSEKESEISALVYSGSAKRLKEEIDKCVVLCANCHMEEHYLERINEGKK